MAGHRRRKPLVSFEYGTRIYAPSEGEPRYLVVATDADGRRVFAKFSSEDAALHRAREIESRLASSVLPPGRANAPTTVEGVGAGGGVRVSCARVSFLEPTIARLRTCAGSGPRPPANVMGRSGSRAAALP